MNPNKSGFPQFSFIKKTTSKGSSEILQNRLITSQSSVPTTSSTTSTTTTFQLPSNVNLAIEVTTTGPEELRNRRYKLKCVRIQRQIKEFIFLNAALQGEVSRNKEKLTKAKNERKFLTNKLLSWQKADIINDANSQRILQQALSKRNNSNNERQSSTSLTSLTDGIGGGGGGGFVGGGVSNDESGSTIVDSKKVQRPSSTPLPTR